MVKKFSYLIKDQNDLYNEQIIIEFPDVENPATKARYLTNEQKISMWLAILDRYGAKEFEFNHFITINNQLKAVFKKLNYK
jgi:hypothetical protein